jgi:F0F1-type ATP synthase epsilon subunit
MVVSADKTFRCVVIAPAGRLLDCQAASVIFPAHDGQVGILYNHMPMFCRLGLGIMEVKSDQADQSRPVFDGDKIRVLIDGGFALVSSNLLTIIASDAVCSRGLEKEKVQQVLEKSRKKLAGGALTGEQRRYEMKKNTLLESL